MQSDRTIWQNSGGPAMRSYADVFLRHGVGLIGPGDPGPWSSQRYAYDFALCGFVEAFACKVRPGDVFLLRSGASAIRAIGLVTDDYTYENRFDDVNGWDLQHCRRVRWCELPSPHEFGLPLFGANPSRFSRVQKPQLIDYVNRFLNSPPTSWQEAGLPELPPEEPFLQHVPESLQELVAQAHDYVLLAESRTEFPEYPSEDEIVSHFVVPFLHALGWPPERIAVKWRYIDVALFSRLPRVPENCCLVIEAKRLGAGVEGALGQAQRYVGALGSPRDIVVTDGVRYRMYAAAEDHAPLAYANLVRLKQSALKLFERMQQP